MDNSLRKQIELQVRAGLLEAALRSWDNKVKEYAGSDPYSAQSPAPLWYWDWEAFEKLVQLETAARCNEVAVG